MEETIINAQNRKTECDPKKVVELYDQQRNMKREINEIRNTRNQINKKLQKEKNQNLIEESKITKKKLSELESHLEIVNSDLSIFASKIPNHTHPLAPVGPEDQANIIRLVGDFPSCITQRFVKNYFIFYYFFNLIFNFIILNF